MGIVRRREWAWALAWALLVMAFTTVPYVAAARNQGDTWRFSGALLAVEDGNSYIADMLQGARGAWLFTLPYSHEPHTPVLFFGFYLLLGKLAGPSHGALVTVFHAARFVGGAALLLVSYRFLAEFLPTPKQRRLGLVLVALGGGLGWLLSVAVKAPLYGSLPVDFISPEAFSFLVLLGLPHLAVARCFFLLGLLAYLHGRGGAAGLAWLGVGLLQPLYVAVAWLIVAADVALGLAREWRQLPADVMPLIRMLSPRVKTALVAGALSAPMLLYTIAVFSIDPVLAAWNAQNRLPSPHPLHYVVAYGVWLVPALAGLRWLWRAHRPLAQLAAGWLLLAPVLLYLPIPTQRRLIEAVQLPLAALAVLGLRTLAARWRRPLVVGMLVITTPTALLLWAGAMLAAIRPTEPAFLPAQQAAAFERLAEEASPGQVVLAAYETGNALPAYAPVAAYIGHGPETIGLEAKRPRVAAFYAAGTPDAERRALLAEGGINYVLWGPRERALGGFDPRQVEYLRLRHMEGGYGIFEVVE